MLLSIQKRLLDPKTGFSKCSHDQEFIQSKSVDSNVEGLCFA